MDEALPAKRQRREGALADCVIFVAQAGIPHAARKQLLWSTAVADAGGAVVDDPEDPRITHCILGAASVAPAELGQRGQRAAAPLLVREQWLQHSLQQRARLSEADYQPVVEPARREEPPADGRGLSWQRRWLGEARWEEGAAALPALQLALRGCYDSRRSTALGNEPLVRALKELQRLEAAVAAPGGDRGSADKALTYSQAAAAVRGCSYRVQPPVEAGQLPFGGAATARKINDILSTGTCRELEQFRANLPVQDSKGNARPGTDGATSRASFMRLPGVGAVVAGQWWRRGLRTLEDAEAAALSARDPLPLNAAQRFSLLHRGELLRGTVAAEVEEMRGAVVEALAAATGVREGWKITVVGGRRREERPPDEAPAGGGGDGDGDAAAVDSTAHHDADLLVTHPWALEEERADLVGALLARLVAAGKVEPAERALCMVQRGQSLDWEAALLAQYANTAARRPTRCRLDHLLGVFRLAGGGVRRIDVILAPRRHAATAALCWVGSTQFLRWLYQHVSACGMALNSLGLFRVERGRVWRVPEDAPPLDLRGREWWPPGWGPGGGGGGEGGRGGGGRVVRHERDILELLGLPYREPWERNC